MDRIDDMQQLIRDNPLPTLPSDPIIWLKCAVVLIVFVLSYVVIIKYKLWEYVNPFDRLKRKIERAKNKGNVIQATLVEERTSWLTSNDQQVFSGTYTYELNGKTKKLSRFFNENRAPEKLNLYYIDSPHRLFSYEEYNGGSPIFALLTILLNFSPFIIAVLAAFALGLGQDLSPYIS